MGLLAYGLSRALSGTYGSAIVAAIVGLLSFVVTKTFEYQKQREAVIAEKKRDIYKRLLAPWIQVIVDAKAGKSGDDVTASINFSELYASSFDAALYGSDDVVNRYVSFRSPEVAHDTIDMLRALAALVKAMREDVTGQKSKLSEEAILRTFVTFKPEELVVLRLRDYVAKNPQAQKQLAEILAKGPAGSKTTATPGQPV